MPKASGDSYQTGLPAAVNDGVVKAPWMSRYGSAHQIPQGIGPFDALDPILYRAITPTFGTGIAMSSAARTGFLATECTALFRNTAGAGGKYVIPLWVRMIITAAGTAGTNAQFGLIVDNINRYSSGGSTLTGGVGTNAAKSDASDTPVCTAYAGAITASAASAQRAMGRGGITRAAATAFVVGDEILVTFGSAESVPPQVLAATASRYVVPFGPIALAPGHSALLHFWSAAQTAAPSAEYEMAWAEL